MQGALLIVMGAVLLFAFFSYRHQYDDRSAPWLAAGYLLAGVGLMLLALEHHGPLWLIVPLGNLLFLLFSAFASRALALATRQRTDGFYPLAAFSLLAVLVFSFWRPTGLERSLVAGILTSAMYLVLIAILLRSKEVLIRPAVRVAIGLLMFEILTGLIRLTVWVYTDTNVWFPGMNIVTAAGLAIAYLWMNQLRTSERLERTAMTDPLTGLYNRRAMDLFGGRELGIAGQRGLASSALMIDLDRFKEVNDQLGHPAGDALLTAVAGVLLAIIRPGDVVARLGGDEFFVLLPGTDTDAARVLVARIEEAVRAIRLTTPSGKEYGAEASVGSATLHGGQATMEDLLHASDIMLYRAKQVSRSTRAFLDLPDSPDEGGLAAFLQ